MDRNNDGGVKQPAPVAGVNLDQVRIAAAARMRDIMHALADSGNVLETLCEGIMYLQDRNAALEKELAAMKAAAQKEAPNAE